MVVWDPVSRDDVVRAIQEYDRLGAPAFFAAHGFAPTTTYDLVWDERRYPPKAILGTAYEFATGQRLASGDFEGGKSGAVKVLGKLGFTVEHHQRFTCALIIRIGRWPLILPAGTLVYVTSGSYGPQPVRYEISVAGHLGETMRAAFPALRAQRRGAVTALTGALPDQAALYGVLAEIEALGLELLEVRRLPPAGEQPPREADPPDRTRRLHPFEGETREDDYGTGSPT